MTDKKQGTDPKVAKLRNVRLSFSNLFEARAFDANSTPNFSARFLFDPGSEEGKANLAAIKSAIAAAIAEKWGENAPKLKPNQICLRDGSEESWDGYEGMFYIAASTGAKNPPTVYDRDRTPITEDKGRVYNGCYVNAIVACWAQDNQWGKRVNATLKGVQFVGDGEPFSGAKAASADDFDDLGFDDEHDDALGGLI